MKKLLIFKSAKSLTFSWVGARATTQQLASSSAVIKNILQIHTQRKFWLGAGFPLERQPSVFAVIKRSADPLERKKCSQVSNKGIFYVYTYAVRKLHVKLYTPLTCWYVLKIQYVCWNIRTRYVLTCIFYVLVKLGYLDWGG